MQNKIEYRIKELLEEKFKEEGFEDCFLIEIKLHAHNKLDVFVDSDTGINYVKCQRLSRHLEKEIDAGSWLGEKYVLEVSSPGIGRPLKFARQYPRNIGRKMVISTSEGKFKGLMVEANESVVVLENKVRVKVGKKKHTEIQRTEIPMDQITKAIVKTTF